MNRTEQKERLKDIITLAEDVIVSLTDKDAWLQKALSQIEALTATIEELGENDAWDADEVREAVCNQLFEHEFEELHEKGEEFQQELDEYASELSDARREALEERYHMFDEVLSKFSQSEMEYEDTTTAIEHIRESIEELKQMRK